MGHVVEVVVEKVETAAEVAECVAPQQDPRTVECLDLFRTLDSICPWLLIRPICQNNNQ